jgi:hypothetical protein
MPLEFQQKTLHHLLSGIPIAHTGTAKIAVSSINKTLMLGTTDKCSSLTCNKVSSTQLLAEPLIKQVRVPNLTKLLEPQA